MSTGTNRIIPLLIVAFILVATAPTFAGHIIYVDDDGPADFNNIQAAIDDSNDGDTIIVAEGTYFENISFMSKNIIVRSTDSNDLNVVAGTIIDGNNVDSVVTFTGTENETCVLAGFTIRNGYGGYAAGICGGTWDIGTHATIKNNIITRNSAYGGGSVDGYGGGISYCDGIIQNNIVTSNSARWDGGGLLCCDGTIQSNVITGNSAACGGGLAYCNGIIQNNIVANNSTIPWYGCGGGLYSCNGTIQNNTILGNSVNHRGGGLYECYGFIHNCIIWGNRAGDCGNQLYESNFPFFSCVQDWTGGGSGNINHDPLFADASRGDYHIQAGSPCIDSGANGYWLAWPLRDLDGNCRLAGERIDIGCYEYGASPDSDGDLLSNSDESLTGTNSLDNDTDGDGLRDGVEVLRGSDPLTRTPPRIVHILPEISKIQESLGIAVDGDEIVVAPGIYVENLCFFGVNVTLRSSDPGNPNVVALTILDGGGSGPVVSFTGNEGEESVLAGFTLRGGRASRGGGILGNGTYATIQKNAITSNSAVGWRAAGGGLYCCDGTIQNNTISENWTLNCGGGLFDCDGMIQNNSIRRNWASNYGGGLYNCDGTIQNNVIASNWTYDCAGGLGWCKGTLLNNTIVGNWTDNNGDNLGWCDGLIVNCIIWGNTESDPANLLCASSTPSFSCIQGWTRGGEGNISDAPCFVDTSYWDANGVWIEGDYHLLWDSPCIDAGDPNYIAEPNETDLDGKPRVMGGRIDMGTYEYTPPISAEVQIVPRTINLQSKGKWIAAFLRLPEEYNVADIDPNSVLLENEIEPERFSVNEQQQVATAKFIREDVQPILEVGEIELKITGRLNDGTLFEASDIITVIDKSSGKKPPNSRTN